MANSAFNHSPTIVVPGSSTNTALVRWSGTGGKTFLDSTLVLSTSATPTLGIAADPDLLTFGNGTLAITGTVTGISTITATTFSGALSGNATSATSAATLTTARTIGGVSFNGSAAINLPGVNAAGDQNTSGTAAGLSTALVVASGGTGLTSYTAGDMFYYASGTTLTKLAKGTADQVLTMNDGATAPGWEDAAGGGTTVAGTTDNGILTFVNSGSTFASEANLRFDGTDLTIKSTGKLHFGDGTDTYFYQRADDQLALYVGGRHMFQVRGGGVFFGFASGTNSGSFEGDALPNDPSGGSKEAGVHIHQGSADAAILTFSSSDVVHTMTNTAAANTFGFFQKFQGPGGGLRINGYMDGDVTAANENSAIVLGGFITDAADTTRGTAANGVITLDANRAYSSSSSAGVQTADGNLVTIRDETTARFIFDEDGDGHADSAWTTYSDGRLKFNQEVIPYGLDTLMQLQPKVYDRDSGYVADGVPVLEGKRKRQIGFIAQEVKEIIPEVIKDVDETNSWYSLDDGKLMAVVIKAIQELKAEVDALKG